LLRVRGDRKWFFDLAPGSDRGIQVCPRIAGGKLWGLLSRSIGAVQSLMIQDCAIARGKQESLFQNLITDGRMNDLCNEARKYPGPDKIKTQPRPQSAVLKRDRDNRCLWVRFQRTGSGYIAPQPPGAIVSRLDSQATLLNSFWPPVQDDPLSPGRNVPKGSAPQSRSFRRCRIAVVSFEPEPQSVPI
jgi:hypothetical protein